MTPSKTEIRQNIFQVLSLDVVLGALATGIFAARLVGVGIDLAWLAVLAGAVWVVYTLDHLLDGLKTKENSHIYRHRFHYLHRRAIILTLAVAALLTAILAFSCLENNILLWGAYLSLFVLGYFALHYLYGRQGNIYFQKELIIAAVYISGIFLAPLAWHDSLPEPEILIIIAVLFLLAWSEGIINSYYDFGQDKADKLQSFTTVYGRKNTRVFLIVLLSITMAMLFFWLITNPVLKITVAIVIEILMSLVLLVLISFPDYFRRKEVFRWIGEGTFLIPLVIIFF